MNAKLKHGFFAITLAASLTFNPVTLLAQDSVCEIIAQLAKTVGQGRMDGLTRQQQTDIAKFALTKNRNKEIYKLHMSMIDNAYRNDLDAEAMTVIYYLACSKAGLNR